MHHLVARRAHRTLIYRTDLEARALWRMLVRGLPGLRGLVLMPDHLHVMHPADVRLRLARVLSGYTRWLEHHRGTPGPGFEPIPAAELLADEQKIRRSLRYLHLNPCRDGLADDPLAWAFSTHRDACGLMVQPVVPPRRDPAGFHAYVSADPHVSITGTPLPGGQLARMPVLDVLAAVSAVTRTTLSGMKQRGPARTLFLAASAELSSGERREAAALVGVHPSQVTRARAAEGALRVVRSVLGDPRFALLDGAQLPRTPAWRAYVQRKHLRLLPGDV